MIGTESSIGLSPTLPGPRRIEPEPFLSVYMREMGSNPRLDADQEQSLARRLERGRLLLSRLAGRAPERLRDALPAVAETASPPDLPALSELDRYVDALVAYVENHEDTAAIALLGEVRRAKVEIDRARERLIVCNLRLVVHLAKRYVSSGLPFQDLIQEGNIGLMRAVEKFEYRRGHKFSTYAYWWIKQSIDRALVEKGRLIRIPFHLAEQRKKLFRARAELRRELGRKPAPLELAERAELPLGKVEQLLGISDEAKGFDDFTDEEDRDLTQVIPDPQARPPVEQVVDDEIRACVEESLALLDPREEEVVRLRYGIGRDSAHTLREIGTMVKLSRERVRQIVVSALGKLRGADPLRDFDSLSRTG